MSAIEQAPPPPKLTPDLIPGLTPGKPERVLGLFDATCVVVGAIIGVGIFFTPKAVAGLTHTAGLALVAWAVAGAIALCGALTFAALGRRYHASGAQYEVLRDAYGPLPAFVFVFCNATVIQPGAIAIIAIVCANHTLLAVAGYDPPNPNTAEAIAARVGLAALLIGALMAANFVGVRWGSRIQNLTVVAKLAALLAIVAAAALLAPESVPAGSLPETTAPASQTMLAITAVMAALVPCFFSYGGWQHALWISGEVREPRRNLPRAIVGGVLVVIVVYLLANWAYLRLLGAPGVANADALAADAARVAVPRFGARLVAGAVAVSAFGVLNAQFLSGPRLLFGMAADGRFFTPFARLHSRFGTPTAAICLLGGFAVVLLGVAGFRFNAVELLLNGVVAVDSVFFGLTGAAVFVLIAHARRQSADPGPLRSLGYPIIPACFVLGELGVVAGSFMDKSTRTAAILGGVWIVVAAVLYVVRFRQPRPT